MWDRQHCCRGETTAKSTAPQAAAAAHRSGGWAQWQQSTAMSPQPSLKSSAFISTLVLLCTHPQALSLAWLAMSKCLDPAPQLIDFAMLILLPWRRNGSRALGWNKYPGFFFGGVSRATVTLLDITSAWRAAGFTGVVMWGRGILAGERKWLLGVGQVLPLESPPQVIPNLHYTDQNLVEIPFSQPGNPDRERHIPNNIHQNTFYFFNGYFLVLSTMHRWSSASLITCRRQPSLESMDS